MGKNSLKFELQGSWCVAGCEVTDAQTVGPAASRENVGPVPAFANLITQHTKEHCTLIQLWKEQHLVRKNNFFLSFHEFSLNFSLHFLGREISFKKLAAEQKSQIWTRIRKIQNPGCKSCRWNCYFCGTL